MSKQIKVSDEVHQRLMGAKSDTETVSDLIARLLDDSGRLAATTVPIDKADSLLEKRLVITTAPIDEADALVEQLDNENEHPEDYLSEEDRAILRDLAPGELPACCQEIFDDPEHPVPTCKHWRQAYENYSGQKMWGYVNDLVGGGYRTWFSKYVK